MARSMGPRYDAPSGRRRYRVSQPQTELPFRAQNAKEAAMNRIEMIDVLVNKMSGQGTASPAMRKRCSRMSDWQLERELLQRGLIEFDDPDEDDWKLEGEVAADARMRGLLGLPSIESLAD